MTQSYNVEISIPEINSKVYKVKHINISGIFKEYSGVCQKLK
jgi:hypothetical protein